MRNAVGFKNEAEIKQIVDRLNRYYGVLMESLSGDEPTEEELQVSPRQYVPHLYVDVGDARTAIDSMINALKEARKFFK